MLRQVYLIVAEGKVLSHNTHLLEIVVLLCSFHFLFIILSIHFHFVYASFQFVIAILCLYLPFVFAYFLVFSFFISFYFLLRSFHFEYSCNFFFVWGCYKKCVVFSFCFSSASFFVQTTVEVPTT